MHSQKPATGFDGRHGQHDAAIQSPAPTPRATPPLNDRLAAMIDLALDDLAEGHADLPTILRVLAIAAWHEGRNDAHT